MANIRISPDAMRGRAGSFRGQADAVNGVINTMTNLLGQLQGEWEGAASKSFSSRFEELKPNFVKAEELIREIASALDSTANAMEQADADIASQY